MTSTPSPGSHPHTDHDAEMAERLEPTLVDIESGIHLFMGHDGQSDEANDWVTDLMAEAITPHLKAAVSTALADRDRLAARVETLEAFVAKVRQLDWEAQTHGDFGAAVANALAAIPPSALRAPVAPYTPTSPTDTTAGDDEYGDGAAAFVRERMATSPTDTGDPT